MRKSVRAAQCRLLAHLGLHSQTATLAVPSSLPAAAWPERLLSPRRPRPQRPLIPPPLRSQTLPSSMPITLCRRPLPQQRLRLRSLILARRQSDMSIIPDNCRTICAARLSPRCTQALRASSAGMAATNAGGSCHYERRRNGARPRRNMGSSCRQPGAGAFAWWTGRRRTSSRPTWFVAGGNEFSHDAEPCLASAA